MAGGSYGLGLWVGLIDDAFVGWWESSHDD
jgi:hypothetical protein